MTEQIFKEENLNIDEVNKIFTEWLNLVTVDYMDKNNARFHIRYDSVGIFQMVIQ